MAGAELEQRVKEIIVDVYGRSRRERALAVEDIEDEAALYATEEGEESLGFDSLDALEIAYEIEGSFDVVLPVELDPVDVKTVRQISLLVEGLLKEQRPEGGQA